MLPGNNTQIIEGSLALPATGVVASTTNPSANGYNILLDAQAQATSTLTIAIQVLDPITGNFSTPTTIGNPTVSQPITLTNATTQIVQCPGAWPGIQANVTNAGTSTGTVRVVITVY